MIARSDNGGDSWAQQLSGTETDLFAVSFIDTLTGWVLGENNLILHTTDGGDNWGTLVNIDNQEYNTPNGFALIQNYPNPFNSVTTISYEINHSGNVTLSIYDIRGREILRLFDGFRSSGRYESIWNGMDRNRNEVASGVYIATLRLNNESVRSMKLMLLK